jgi:hypothetical protein
MSTHYLRFDNEAAGIKALKLAGLLDVDGVPIVASHNHALDVVGVIYKGGSYKVDGTVITPPVAIPGWHVNYIGTLPDGWSKVEVEPTTPSRVFA